MLTTQQAFWHCMSLVLGLGTLTIPYTLRQLGWFGLIVLAVLAWLSAHTAKLLCYCIDYVPKGSQNSRGAAWVLSTYPDIGEAAFGQRGRAFVSWILYVDLVASAALFLVFIATNLRVLFPGVMRQESWVLCVGASLLPTVWLKLQKLSFLSTIGSVIMLLLVATVLYAVWSAAPESLEGNEYLWFNFEMGAIGNMVFAFACHGTLLTIYREMKNPSDVGKLFNSVYFTGYMLKFLVGASGYYLFAQNTMDQVTLNLPIVWLKMFITIVVSIKKWLTYALPLEPCAVAGLQWALEQQRLDNRSNTNSETDSNPVDHSRGVENKGKLPAEFRATSSLSAAKRTHKSIVSLLGANATPAMINLVVRSLLVLSTIVLALWLPKFGLFQALVGSLCAGFLVLLFPVAFYLKLYGNSLSRELYAAYVVLLASSTFMVALACYFSLLEASELATESHTSAMNVVVVATVSPLVEPILEE